MIDSELHERLAALAERAADAPDRVEQVLQGFKSRTRRTSLTVVGASVIAAIAVIAVATTPGWVGQDRSRATLAGPAASSTSPVASPSTSASVLPPGGDCPTTVTSKGGATMIDYVDFVQANGRMYIAGLQTPVAPLPRADLAGVVLRVRCSLQQLNDATHQPTPPPRDGDAAFLSAGTPVFAIRGWSPQCRLAAERGGRLEVYLAYRPGGKVATPEPCALHR